MNIKIILSEGKLEATIEIKGVHLSPQILATVADALASLKTTLPQTE